MPSFTDAVTLGKGFAIFKEDGRNGYFDLGEIDEFKFSESVEKVEKFSNRSKNVVKIASTVKQTTVNGSFTLVTPKLEILRLFGLAKEVSDAQQASGSLTDQSYTARLAKWIKIDKVNLSNVKVISSGTACTADNLTDKFTATGHGLNDNDTIEFTNQGGALPAGINADTTYYVINSTANDFQVSTTQGGAAVDFTDDGTGTHYFHKLYAADTDYEVDTAKGLLYTVSGGGIADGDSILVSADYAQSAMYEFEGSTKTEIKGELEFYGDPVTGVTMDFFATVVLSPEGDLSLIGDDYQTFQINFECLENKTLRSGLYTLRDRSGKSSTVPSV